jgi:ABC-type amino acid transport substrate-binding protein
MKRGVGNAIALATWLAMVAMASCQPAPLPEPNTIDVCVVERAPFSACTINSPDTWLPSYQVDLFKAIVDGLDPATKSMIKPNWQCVGRTTPELVQELGRPQDTRSCDVVIAPMTITEERKQNVSFVTGVYYTYAIPLSAANDQGVGNELTFWLRPFQTSAWILNLGL